MAIHGEAVTYPAMLIDKYMPAFHVSRRYETVIDAPTDVVYHTIRHLDFGHSRVLRLLFWLRRVPASMCSMDAIAGHGMTLLEERPGTEFVLGVIGRFWRSRRVDVRTIVAHEFRAYQPQGYGKAVWDFRVEPTKNGACVLSTETRVYCPDDVTRRMFALYWFFVGPFSGVIRKLLLHLARTEAEAARAFPARARI